MKRLALIFCGEDTDSAKALSAEIRADYEWRAIIISGFEFNGKEHKPDRVVIMNDLPSWHSDRIVAAYPSAERKQKAGKAKPIAIPEKIDEEAAFLPKYMKHRGRGRFYVMQGTEIVSGPHTKAEAAGLL